MVRREEIFERDIIDKKLVLPSFINKKIFGGKI